MDTGRDAPLEMQVNFGANQRWYTRRYRPSSEQEVLALLERHAGGTIRVIGSKHSWSGIGSDADVTLDMTLLRSVEPIMVAGEHFVRVGAGCRLKDLLAQLHRRTDRTLPTLGAITQQTVSGAISTGTHGSGRQSLSHFVTRIRAAVCDAATGRWEIQEFSGGAELLAARCGLGCVGVILSVELPTVPKFMIAETIRIHADVEDILRVYADRPLTQFLWSPYGWTWVVFERAPIERRSGPTAATLKTWLFRAFHLAGLDVGFHLGVLLMRRLGTRATKTYFRLMPYLLPRDIERIDDSHRVLTMKHHYFRHEEMELFVRQSDLASATELLRIATEIFAGAGISLPPALGRQLDEIGCREQLSSLRGSYVHHYPLFFRRVMPEDTMISMAAAVDEPLISISIFTYCRAGKRESYYAFCAFLARVFLGLFKARLHWGKHFPLQYADVAPLYPRLDEFRALCRSADPRGVLRNGYTTRVLALPPGPRDGAG